jgi:hypothetical protein
LHGPLAAIRQEQKRLRKEMTRMHKKLSRLRERKHNSLKRPTRSDDALFRRLISKPLGGKYTIALVGTSEGGFHGRGKASPLYFPKFDHALARRGVSLVAYPEPAVALSHIDDHDPARTAFILIYNETKQRELLQNFAELTSRTEFRFYNPPSVGETIGDKRSTNRLFSTTGIPVPPLVNTEATIRVFSNAAIGSRKPTAIIGPGQAIDRDRYNTRFIDTAHEYRGKSYYVSLRTLAVTGDMISAYVRLRPTGEAEASVHNKDTPKDPQLISHFHETLIEANRGRLIQLCEQIGKVLGPGFYAHDILPCRDTGELYVCEAGFKFDDLTYQEALWPISSDLRFLTDHSTYAFADLAAEAVIQQCFGELIEKKTSGVLE